MSVIFPNSKELCASIAAHPRVSEDPGLSKNPVIKGVAKFVAGREIRANDFAPLRLRVVNALAGTGLRGKPLDNRVDRLMDALRAIGR